MFDVSSSLLPCFLAALVFIAPSVSNGEQPARVVSLSPNLTELVFDLGLGDFLVGRSSACDYPTEVSAVPIVGDFGRPNLELLTSIRPNYVLVTDLENRSLLNWLEKEGVRALVLPCENWESILEAAQRISAVLGDPSAGDAWKDRVLARRASLRRKVDAFYGEEKRPRVYVEVWGDPLTTSGDNTFLDSAVELAGGRNIGQGLGDGYIHASAEWIVRENPDVILLAYMLPKISAQAAVGKRIGWGAVKAVRENAICNDIDPDLLLRPGPRLLDGTEQLAMWLMRHAAPNVASNGVSPHQVDTSP